MPYPVIKFTHCSHSATPFIIRNDSVIFDGEQFTICKNFIKTEQELAEHFFRENVMMYEYMKYTSGSSSISDRSLAGSESKSSREKVFFSDKHAYACAAIRGCRAELEFTNSKEHFWTLINFEYFSIFNS